MSGITTLHKEKGDGSPFSLDLVDAHGSPTNGWPAFYLFVLETGLTRELPLFNVKSISI